MINQLMTLSLFGAGVGYVPECVFHSKAFWLLLAVVIAGIFLYHNIFLSKMAKNSFLGKRFGFLAKMKVIRHQKSAIPATGAAATSGTEAGKLIFPCITSLVAAIVLLRLVFQALKIGKNIRGCHFHNARRYWILSDSRW